MEDPKNMGLEMNDPKNGCVWSVSGLDKLDLATIFVFFLTLWFLVSSNFIYSFQFFDKLQNK